MSIFLKFKSDYVTSQHKALKWLHLTQNKSNPIGLQSPKWSSLLFLLSTPKNTKYNSKILQLFYRFSLSYNTQFNVFKISLNLICGSNWKMRIMISLIQLTIHWFRLTYISFWDIVFQLWQPLKSNVKISYLEPNRSITKYSTKVLIRLH